MRTNKKGNPELASHKASVVNGAETNSADNLDFWMMLTATQPHTAELVHELDAHGELQFTLPDVLKLPPISHHGNVNEIIGKFGGADQLRTAVNQLQSLLYAA